MLNKKAGIFLVLLIVGLSSWAQYSGTYFEGRRIYSVAIQFKNTFPDSVSKINMLAKIQRVFPVYPQSAIRSILLDAYTARVRQLAEVETATYEIQPSQTGDIDIILTVTCTDKVKEQKPQSGLFAGSKGFPLLYSDNKTLLTAKLSISQMLYSNGNAWYANDSAMLAGNPLKNNPAGKGYTGWIEGWASAGVYGITTLSKKADLFVYGGLNYIVSGSAGQEIFTDKSRFYGGIDDAYIGLVGTKTFKKGSRLTYNLSAGRQAFTIGQGFIIRNTAANGDNRGALQLNPRWAADYLGLAAVKYNNLLLQFFHINPDELPVVDSKTIIRGINVETDGKDADKLGISVLHVPNSTYNYYTPDGKVFGRQGLWVYNLRYYSKTIPGKSALFFKTELGYERNSHFNMAAFAGYAEAGWNFAQSKGAPVLIYRYAYFSGDNPATQRFERWDPLLTGGNGEDWVLGANHFKIVQNSNIIVHKLQLNVRPVKKVELVPQLLYMYAAQKNNIGGNPALSVLPAKPYGSEANISWKYFHSRQWYFHGHFACTFPGSGVTKALSNSTKPWFSAMIFFRYSIF
jgi:hypothetical protein